jgi:thioredoxin 1
MVYEIESLEEFVLLLKEKSDYLFVIDFFATWCGPCKVVAPVYENLAKSLSDKKVIFCKMDIENESLEQVVASFKIQSMPTFVIAKLNDECTQLVELFKIAGGKMETLKNKIEDQLLK